MTDFSKRISFEATYTKEKSVVVNYDPGAPVDIREPDGLAGTLMAYVEGDMQDGFDYEEYEERLRVGEDFETVAQEIVDALEAQDY